MSVNYCNFFILYIYIYIKRCNAMHFTSIVPDWGDVRIDRKTPPENYKSRCGKRNVRGVDVTVDGKADRKELTQFGEWPNMCAISVMVSICVKWGANCCVKHLNSADPITLKQLIHIFP